MSATYFRYDGWVQTPTGEAVPGASVAVLTQPANFTSTPGSPLATIYGAPNSHSATITAASWFAQQITFTFSTTPPADVIAGSYISVSGVNPSGFNGIWLVVSVPGNNVVVQALTNPGTWISGGTVATSVLPNPLSTDGNGHYFFYVLPGLYSIQVYGPTIEEQDYPDQGVGTVAGGSVLSVGLSLPGEFTVSGSPVTTSGNLTAAWANESANKVFAGPTSGGAGTPSFRSLVLADLPGGIGAVTSVGFTLAVPGIFTQSVTGSPVTSTGTLAATIALANEAANSVWAGPSSGGSALPTFRILVAADIPPGLVTTLSGSTDAIVFSGSDFITTVGVDATTLATPVAGGPGVGDDGKIVRIFDVGGHAHTVTTASNKIVPSHHLVTFGGIAGSYIEFEAFGGLWYPKDNLGVVIS